MRELHLFAGCGGGILGGMLLGHRPVCAVEIAPHCRRALLQRQRDGWLPRFPIWDDVRTFDGGPWRGLVDVVAGGFPCQDISTAGNGAGIDGERSGLWSEMYRIIGEIRPRFAFVENSPAITSRGLYRVLGDLASLGYDAEWGVFSAASIGGEHVRERLFILADSDRPQRQGRQLSRRTRAKNAVSRNARWGKDTPGVDRASDAVANWVERLTSIGNGQVPAVVELAWRTLMERLLTT